MSAMNNQTSRRMSSTCKAIVYRPVLHVKPQVVQQLQGKIHCREGIHPAPGGHAQPIRDDAQTEAEQQSASNVKK
jgi:hypothetical protein